MSLLMLQTSCQNSGAIHSKSDSSVWREKVENTTIQNLIDFSTMLGVNQSIQTPTESWATKFASLQNYLEELTGETLPFYLTPELAELTVTGWTPRRIRPIGGLSNIRNVSLPDTLQLFSEILGFTFQITEHGFLFALNPEFHRELNPSGDTQSLFPNQSDQAVDIFGLPIQ